MTNIQANSHLSEADQARYRDAHSQEQECDTVLPSPEEEKIEFTVIDSIEQVVMELKKLGISHQDLYRETEHDSHSVREMKQRLKSRIGRLVDGWARRRSAKHKERFADEQKEAQAQVDKEIERFLNFDHTRDRDGKQSLGETGRNTSAFEKGLLARELVKRGREVKRELSGFKEKLTEKVGQIRETLMQELAQKALSTGIHVAAVQTGMPIGVIKQSVDMAQQVQSQQDAMAKNPQQQAAATQQLIHYANDVATGQVAPPATPGDGFVDSVLKSQSSGGVGR